MTTENATAERVRQSTELIRGIALEDLGLIFAYLADLVYKVRQDNAERNLGGVPKSVFEYVAGMGGMYTCVQIVNMVYDRSANFVGFALKQRDATEAGGAWAGLYHSTCATMRMYDTPEKILLRNLRETVIPGFVEKALKDVRFLGTTIHHEPERRTGCITIMHSRTVTEEEVKSFVGIWKVFSPEDVLKHDPRIVDHNWYLLEWVLDSHRTSFADVRNGWKGR